MNATKRTSVSPRPKKTSATLTDDQVDEILFPDLSTDQFKLIDFKNQPHTFRIRVLGWRWERIFRKACMPIVETELKPFERVIYMFATKMDVMKDDLELTHSFTQSEVDADIHLTNCVLLICVSQDPEILNLAAQGQEIPLELELRLQNKYRAMIENGTEWPGGSARNYLREIVRKQCEKLKMVQTLGESLMARFGEISTLTGTRSTFDSLKAGFMQQATSFMEKAGKAAGIPAKSSTPSMDSGSATNPAEEKQIDLVPEVEKVMDEIREEVLPVEEPIEVKT